MIHLLILAAGYGTRLYPLTNNTPKALLPVVGDLTVLDILLDSVLKTSSASVDGIYIVSNDTFFPQFTEWTKFRDEKIVVFNDGTTSDVNRRGAIGDLVFALQEIGDMSHDFLILGSDNIFVPFESGFFQYAFSKKKPVIGLYDIKDPILASQYGVVTMADGERITQLYEKPRNPPSTLVSACLYYMPKEDVGQVYKYLEEEKKKKDEIGYFVNWLIEHDDVYGYLFKGKWFDIGSKETYEAMTGYFREKRR